MKYSTQRHPRLDAVGEERKMVIDDGLIGK